MAKARAVALVGGDPAPDADLWEWFVAAFPQDAQRRELVEQVAAAARTLSGLLNDLLDVGRLQAGVFVAALAPTPLTDILECAAPVDWSSVDLVSLTASPPWTPTPSCCSGCCATCCTTP